MATKVEAKSTTATTDTLPLRTSHLAKKFGMKPTQLRRVLRSMEQYADGVHTNYRWAENDPAIKAIEARIQQLRNAREAKAAAAKQAIAEAAKQGGKQVA